MRPERQTLAWMTLARFVIAVSLLLWADQHAGVWLQQAVLPWLQAAMQMWDDTYRIEALGLSRVGADRVFEVTVSLARCVVMDGLSVCPGTHKGLARASTLAGSVDLVLILLWAGGLSWPAQRCQEYVWRVGLFVPMTGLLWSVDVPLILLGAIWSLHHDAYVPLSWSALLAWSEFLKSGGRLVLVGVAVLGVVLMAQQLVDLNLIKRYKLFISFQ